MTAGVGVAGVAGLGVAASPGFCGSAGLFVELVVVVEAGCVELAVVVLVTVCALVGDDNPHSMVAIRSEKMHTCRVQNIENRDQGPCNG